MQEPKTVKLDLTQAQTNFLQCEDEYCTYMGGIAAGKSYVGTLWCILKAIEGDLVLAIYPTYRALIDIAYPLIKQHIEVLGLTDIVKLNQSPPNLEIPGKGAVWFRSAESGERLRGITCTHVYFDEAAIIDENIFRICIGRARKIAVNKGTNFKRFTSTPTGAENWLSKLDGTRYVQATASNPFLPRAYVDDLVKRYSAYSEDFMRQELFGEITNLVQSDVFISQQDVNKALAATIVNDDHQPVVIGCDVAASLAADQSVAVIRKGSLVLQVKSWRIKNSIDLAEEIANLAHEYNASAIVVDAPGVGNGVISALEKILVASPTVIHEFWGWAPSGDSMCANKRAESYALTKKWIDAGGCLPPLPEWEQLTWTRWLQDNKGKILMEPKDNIRKRHGASPDFADALCMSCIIQPDVIESHRADPYESYDGW